MTPTPAPRRYRPSRRGAILDAALEEISARGFAETTLAAVANRVGITITAVYYHFDSKLALLVELVSGVGDRILAALPDDLDEPVRVGDEFLALFDAFAGWVEHHPAEARLFFQRAAGVAPEVEQLRRAWTNRVASAAAERVLAANPELDALTARVIGLSLPTLFEEYVGCLLAASGPAGPGRLRALRNAVVEIGRRLDKFSLPATA